ANNGYRMLITPGIALGQPSLTSQATLSGPLGQSLPLSSWSDGQKLAVADTGNNRVLIWNQFPAGADVPPDIVLGQPDFNTNTANTGGVSDISMNGPITVYWDGTHFIVAEY